MPTDPEAILPDRLLDPFDRTISYLRLSVTDRCDFRCTYCMSEKPRFLPRARLLSLEEIETVARAFVDLGVERIRVTGGEPLVRRNILWLLERLGAIPGLRELTLTTNGSQLARYAQTLARSGVSRVNISLDSLRPERFHRLTRTGDFLATLRGIEAAANAGFRRVKLNTVVLKGQNDDEINDLVAFAIERHLDISFIEEMPLGEVEDHARGSLFCSSTSVRQTVEGHYELKAVDSTTGGPSRYYQVEGTGTRVGFISPHSHNFCDSCNRVRVTAEGRLLLCLGQENSVDLREVIRSHAVDPTGPLKQAIVGAIRMKPKGHEFDLTAKPVILRHMNVTGG